MLRPRAAMTTLLLAALALTGCAKATQSEESREEPATVEAIAGTDLNRLTLAESAVEQVGLEWHGDQLLHLGGGEPERLGLNLDVRGRELGIAVDPHVGEAHHAHRQQRRGGRHDEETELEARGNDRSHHHRTCPSAFTRCPRRRRQPRRARRPRR